MVGGWRAATRATFASFRLLGTRGRRGFVRGEVSLATVSYPSHVTPNLKQRLLLKELACDLLNLKTRSQILRHANSEHSGYNWPFVSPDTSNEDDLPNGFQLIAFDSTGPLSYVRLVRLALKRGVWTPILAREASSFGLGVMGTNPVPLPLFWLCWRDPNHFLDLALPQRV